MQRITLRSEDNWGRFDRLIFWILLILLIVLLILWLFGATRHCCERDVAAPVAVTETTIVAPPVVEPTPVTAIASTPAAMKISYADNVIVADGEVSSEATKQMILATMRDRFDGEVIDRIRITSAQDPFGSAAQVESVVDQMLLTDRASFVRKGNEVTLVGQVATEADRDTVVNEVQAVTLNLPTDGDIQFTNRVAVVAADAALPCDEILSSAAIEFATGSAELTQPGRETLYSLTACLQSEQYLIIGHTDNTGSASVNETLSQQRAQTVTDYLVGIGVKSDRLQPQGAGSSEPIADNATVDGRARNRRIEFRAVN